jgi:hypothetical protein
MEGPGWLQSQLDAAIDRILQQKGLHGGAAEAEARAHRLRELRLDPFADLWRDVAAELRRRIEHGLDA